MRSSWRPFCEMYPLFLVVCRALAPLLAVGCRDWRIALLKTAYVGRSEAGSERRGVRRKDISGDCGGGLRKAAKCCVDFASDCKSEDNIL